MYKVIIQNINQIYFSLQNHQGKRISLGYYEIRTYKGLTSQEANSYKKYIPLGLSVIIQEDNSFIQASCEVVNTDETIEDTSEIVENKNSFNYSVEDLQALKKEDLKELCLEVDIDVRRKTKQELIDKLVAYYGL